VQTIQDKYRVRGLQKLERLLLEEKLQAIGEVGLASPDAGSAEG
jgi:hypothetical protein